MNHRAQIMGLPLTIVREAAARAGLNWIDKGAAANALSNMIDNGAITFADVAGKAVTHRSMAAKPQPQGAAPVGASLVADIKAVEEQLYDLKGQVDRAANLGQLHQSRLMGVEDGVKAVANELDTSRGALAASMLKVSDAVTALDKKADAQAAALRAQMSGIKIDDAAVAVQVSAAVADAFKPFAAAVAAAGAEAVVGSMVAATVVRRDTCAAVFGLEVRDMKGNEVMVDIWDHPAAPAVDDNFIWSADILRHLLLSQDTGENLWLGGEKGTGKSETARQFAARTGRAFTRINFTRHTGVEDFIGATGLVDGATVFEPKGFLMAYTCPSSVILLDEVTNADPAELAVLNGLLEPKAAVTIGGSVWRRAPGVLVFAADNTLTNGDQSGRYAGTRTMNSALADRFSRIIHFAFMDENQEVEAVVRHTGCNEVVARHVVQAVNICRAKVETGDIIDAPSIRSVCAFIRAVQRMPVPDAWASAVAARQPAESAAGLAAVYAATINESLITANL